MSKRENPMRLSEAYQKFNVEINASVPYMVLAANASRLMLSASQLTSMQAHLADWNTRYPLYIAPETHTPPVVLGVKKAYAVFHKEIQAIKLQLKCNKAIELTVKDYTIIGVHKNAAKREAVPRPKIAPDLSLYKQSHAVRWIFASNPVDKESKALPKDVHKIGRKMVIQPANQESPPFSKYQSIESTGKCRFVLTFDASQMGQEAHLMVCYINPRGEEGPYSNPLSFLIT